MRRMARIGDFLLCLLINSVLNPEGFIPAALLLVLHFLTGISVWWTVLATGLWISVLILRIFLIGWAGRCGSIPDPPKENKNPYSRGNGQ